jgi:hypothetical protein
MTTSTTNLFGHGPDHVPMQTNSKQRHASNLSARVVRKTGRSELGVDFQPSEHSVICGRGRQHNSIGNCRFRILAGVFVERYSRADSKTTKAALVFDIITTIRQAGGHFCKHENGSWFEVGDHCARGKVSAFFRDMLHTQYRSSAKAKTTRRSLLNRKKKENKRHGKQQLDGIGGHCDDSSTVSSCAAHSKDSLGFDYSLEIDCSDIDVFYSSMSTPFSGSSTDSLGFDSSLEIDFFDIDVF